MSSKRMLSPGATLEDLDQVSTGVCPDHVGYLARLQFCDCLLHWCGKCIPRGEPQGYRQIPQSDIVGVDSCGLIEGRALSQRLLRLGDSSRKLCIRLAIVLLQKNVGNPALRLVLRILLRQLELLAQPFFADRFVKRVGCYLDVADIDAFGGS